MSTRKIKLIIIGVGAVGTDLVKYFIERECEVVAALDVAEKAGQDIGVMAGLDPLGVLVEANEGTALADAIDRTKPDIVVDCSLREFELIYPHMVTCVERGVNVATTSDIVYYPWIYAPDLAKKLDELCKKQGVSVCAFGVQDANWTTMALALAQNCRRVNRIEGQHVCILNPFGVNTVDVLHCCLTPEQFEAKMEKMGAPERNSYTYMMYSLADQLGLHVTSEENTVVPVYNEEEFTCEESPVTVKKGETRGVGESTVLQTAEGIELKGTIYYVYTGTGEKNRNVMIIEGEPDQYMVQEDMHGEYATPMDLVHRVPDVINAEPGLLTIKDLPMPCYRVINNLGAYVNWDK